MRFTLTGSVADDQLFHDFEIAEPTTPDAPFEWSPVRGLIDTGAQDSHIHDSVAQRMNLPLLRYASVNGVHSEPVQMPVRRIFTRWTSQEGHKIVKPFQIKVGMGIDPAKAEALIGMDMIKWFILTVTHGRSYNMVGEFDPNDFSSQ